MDHLTVPVGDLSVPVDLTDVGHPNVPADDLNVPVGDPSVPADLTDVA